MGKYRRRRIGPYLRTTAVYGNRDVRNDRAGPPPIVYKIIIIICLFERALHDIGVRA